MSGPFEIDGAARARIALVWRQRVALLGVARPTASQVATAAETTCWQVRKMLGGLVAEDMGGDELPVTTATDGSAGADDKQGGEA